MEKKAQEFVAHRGLKPFFLNDVISISSEIDFIIDHKLTVMVDSLS